MLQELTYHTEVLGIVEDILRVRARGVTQCCQKPNRNHMADSRERHE